MIIVTGGFGFIGSNLIKALNDRGRKDIVVVDDLTDGRKFINLVDCDYLDYFDYENFLELLITDAFKDEDIEIVFHQGACSDTTEWDGRFMMKNNYDYSKILFSFCQEYGIPLVYASSAAVYGGGTVFKEERQYEAPLNMYGYSKFQFDQYVRASELIAPVVGLRYFNVYGPREQHKGKMASVAYHNYRQFCEQGKVRLFGAYENYQPGEQRRDFIYVSDVVNINLFFMDHPELSGIFNVGTGRAQTFNDIARTVLACEGRGEIEYIPFPEELRGRYQSFTQADISQLRAVGYKEAFKTVEQGVREYLAWLKTHVC
jgi:ADP-L-glycero-D-manno-heptose 6-epimerase